MQMRNEDVAWKNEDQEVADVMEFYKLRFKKLVDAQGRSDPQLEDLVFRPGFRARQSCDVARVGFSEQPNMRISAIAKHYLHQKQTHLISNFLQRSDRRRLQGFQNSNVAEV